MRRIVLRGLFWTAFSLWSVSWVLSGEGAVASSKGAVLNPVKETIPSQWGESISEKLTQSKRASAQHVGAVMAILGTLNEAEVLPLESDPRANQLIRSLIQFQSVFMKSQEPVVHDYLSSALFARWGKQGARLQELFKEQGWTTHSLEALVDYSKTHLMWEDARMEEVFRQYYLSPADWILVGEIFDAARQHFVAEGQDIHQMFATQRERMARGRF